MYFPDDIQKMAVPVLAYRIIISQEAKMNNYNSSKVIADILQNTKVPVV